MNKFFITTPIYYVNDLPHIGSAYTTLSADVLARAHRLWGEQVYFITGTDEHGVKIARKATEQGESPVDYSSKIALEYEKTWQQLTISYDCFARTTDDKHRYLVGQVVQQLFDEKIIYPGVYTGWYCVACEEYKDSTDISKGNVPTCEVHHQLLEWLEESIYYFALSHFQSQLVEVIESDQFLINPVTRKNEVLSFLKNEDLRDIPVTRSKVKWGISAPFDSEQTIYVWFDALLHYLSFSAPKANLEQVKGHQTCWPADFQLIGKDILRFHAVIWPALLMALNLPLPKQLFVHGFFTVDGEKMSKTTGNVIRPAELVARYGVEATRYLIVSAVPFGADGDISLAKLDANYTAKLANGLGNLLQRTVSLLKRYGIKPDSSVTSLVAAESEAVKEAYLSTDLTQAIRLTDELIANADRFLAERQPWAIADEPARQAVLIEASQRLSLISQVISPLMPRVAEQIKEQLESVEPQPLFPRLES